jgi:hypothetical protein
MRTKTLQPTIASRVAEIQEIAMGLFDLKERRTLLRFVKDCERCSRVATAVDAPRKGG